MSTEAAPENITVGWVFERIAEIEAEQGDDEAQHAAEDSLYRAVLEAIAEGRCGTPAACASAALTTQQMNFSRWYAYPPTCPR